MLRAMGLFAYVAFMCLTLSAQQPTTTPKRGFLPFVWTKGTKPVEIPAPDGKLVLRVVGKKTGHSYPDDEMEPDYFIEKNGRRLSPAIRVYNSPYAVWSSASDLLAITSTDGGLVGSWEVFVYAIVQGRVMEYDVMKPVQADLAHRYPGGINPPGYNFFSDKERAQFAHDVKWVNVLACRWLENPQRLLVNAQVPPSSSCGANMGKSTAYIIEPRSGRILHTYTEKQSERLWKECEAN
jgi:hypothetical protein